MVRLVDDDTARADLSRRGLQRSSLFSWRSTAEGTAAVYREVLGG
jgi:glycosyltransferase involved in cell wall biosynthesis